MVSPQELVTAPGFVHDLADHRTATRLQLAEGDAVEVDAVEGVVNRLDALDVEHLLAEPQERQYAALELTAITASWLASLPVPVLNRPVPPGLSGPRLSIPQWVTAATAAGVPCGRLRHGSGGMMFDVPPGEGADLLVVGDVVVAPPGMPEVEASARRLARALSLGTLGLHVQIGVTGPWFAGAQTIPRLSRTPAVVDAYTRMFEPRQTR